MEKTQLHPQQGRGKNLLQPKNRPQFWGLIKKCLPYMKLSLKNLREKHSAEVARLQETHNKILSNESEVPVGLKLQMNAELRQLENKHNTEMTQLVNNHTTAISNINMSKKPEIQAHPSSTPMTEAVKPNDKKASKILTPKEIMLAEHKAAVAKLEAKHAIEFRAASAENQQKIGVKHRAEMEVLNNQLKDKINIMNSKSEIQTHTLSHETPHPQFATPSIMKNGIGKK